MIPYALLYRLGLTPWERRDIAEGWRSMLDGPDAPLPGRALDVGCGSGRDAIYLAERGWQVTAVDIVDTALAAARQRAADAGVDVQWIRGDVAELGRLGLEPGFDLLYDFGCIQGLSDTARSGAAAGLTALAAPGATLLLLAFAARRRVMLPRGMNREDVVALLSDGWNLTRGRSMITDDMPAPVRRAAPTRYAMTRGTASVAPSASEAE